MPDPKMLRALARRCRGLLASRTKPEVGRQLSIWFREILDQAKQAGGDATNRRQFARTDTRLPWEEWGSESDRSYSSPQLQNVSDIYTRRQSITNPTNNFTN